SGRLVDLFDPGVGNRPARGGQLPGFGYRQCRVLVDEVVVFSVAVQAAQRGDRVLGGLVAAPGVAAHHDVGTGVLGQLPDLGGGRLVQPALAPVLPDPVPVGAVHTAGARTDGGLDPRNVLV